MQLKLTCNADKLTLPINYQYVLQSAIYSHIATDEEKKAFVHNKGWKYEDRSYRLFQFSGLEGRYTVANKQITFDGEVTWEIRSIDARLIQVLQESIREDGLQLLKQELQVTKMKLEDDEIEDEDILIEMISPICVYATDANKHTYFFSPDEEGFAEAVVENFIRKYAAYSGNFADEGIEIIPISVSARDKVITKYKGFYMDGWKGRYRLIGKRKYLNFLYQVGIGAKNAQGFGMFRVI